MRSADYSFLIKDKQKGAALFVSLIMLVLLTTIGLAASKRSSLQEKMAANLHIQNVRFNASESALSGFVSEANKPRTLLAQHVLFNLRHHIKLENACMKSDGTLNWQSSGCTDWLNAATNGNIQSKVSAEIVQECEVSVCGGYSLGTSTGIGCRFFKADAIGSVGNRSTKNSIWVYEVTACN